MMPKKAVLAILLLILFGMGAPLIFSAFFSTQVQGKIVVNRPIDAPYLQDGTQQLQLVFFGYVGCTKVCTPILQEMSSFYNSESFASLKPYVAFTFVNLMPEVESDQPQTFAESFNRDFRGVYLTQRQLMNIDRDFSLFFSKSISEAGEINHSDYLYLVHRDKNGALKLINIYMTHPLRQEMLIEDIHRYRKEI